MNKIEVISLNEKNSEVIENKIIETIEEAVTFFPKETWDIIEYLGKVELKCDIKLFLKNIKLHGYSFQKVLSKIREVKKTLKIKDLTVAVTENPIVYLEHSILNNKIIKKTLIIHDYFNQELGVISLFKIKKELYAKIAAHGLGHSKGLTHHFKPIGLMYINITREPIKINAFCEDCLTAIKKAENS